MYNSHLITFCVYRRNSVVFKYTTSNRFILPIADLFDNKGIVLYDDIYFKLSDLNKCFKLSSDKTNNQTIKNELLSLFKSRIRHAKQFSKQVQVHSIIDICYADDKDIISFIRYIKSIKSRIYHYKFFRNTRIKLEPAKHLKVCRFYSYKIRNCF